MKTVHDVQTIFWPQMLIVWMLFERKGEQTSTLFIRDWGRGFDSQVSDKMPDDKIPGDKIPAIC